MCDCHMIQGLALGIAIGIPIGLLFAWRTIRKRVLRELAKIDQLQIKE